MDRKTLSVLLALAAVLVFFLGIIWIGGMLNPSLQLDETALLRFVFVAIGLVIVFIIYWLTKSSGIWQVGTREVVYMAIGAALYAVFSYLFNGTVFVVPSVSQVALRPAIVIPMFFGYTFGPVVGFFSGAVGNMFGDALTGFGLSPQWSIGNGLVGLVAGLALLYPDKKKSLNNVLIASGVLTLLATVLYFIGQRHAQHAVLRCAQQHLRRPADHGHRRPVGADRLRAGAGGALPVRRQRRRRRRRHLVDARQPDRHRLCRHLRHLDQRLPAGGRHRG